MYNGSERLPTIDANFAATSFGTDGGDLLNNDDVASVLTLPVPGVSALLFKDISFVENLTHQVRLACSTAAPTAPNAMRDHPQPDFSSQPLLEQSFRYHADHC